MSKVLIVDDSALARRLLGNILGNMKHEIVGEADTGEKALLQFNKIMPDIVIMDVVMPGIGGIEAAKKILATCPNTKIIIITSHMQNNLKSELVNAGLKFLVLKPIDEKKLSDVFHQISSGIESNIILDDTAEKKLRTEVRSFLKNIAEDVQKKKVSEESELSVGGKVSVCHYFSEQPMAAIIADIMPNGLLLRFDNNFAKYSFCIDDPITISFLSDKSVKIYEASIIEIISNQKSIRAVLGKVSLLSDEALKESFPTSMPVDFKTEYSNKKQTAVVKNIGPYNSIIVSEDELKVGDKINFNIFLEEKVISLNAEIASKRQGKNKFEYDLKTTFIDLNSKKLLMLFIAKLKGTHGKLVHGL